MFEQRVRRGLRIGACVGLFMAGIGTGRALAPPSPVTPLLATSKTVMDEPIVYPSGTPKITTAIINMAPGTETGWHTHGVPLTGLVLEGALTVDYGDKGTKTYTAGQSIAEAINIPHNGRNAGEGPMKLFVVYIGAEGIPNSTPVKK